MAEPNNKQANNAQKTAADDAHPYANWLTRNLAIITILLTIFGFLSSGSVGIWYASGAYHTIITAIESLQIDNKAIKASIESLRRNQKSDIESVRREAKENNNAIRNDIKRIDNRLDGMDRRLSIIEGRISNLSNDENAPKKTAQPITH